MANLTVVDADHGATHLPGDFMYHALRVADDAVATSRGRLRIHHPAGDIPNSTRWLINGYPAFIVIWSPEEWARLTDRPGDAQQIPNGFWCVLRME